MNSSPLVSVVMPTYNRADLLPQTIESILSQDSMDFELLIVDDGSTDNTADVITQIQEQDPRLRYVSLPVNRGIGFARDAGLWHVSGKYIALADSDDLWLPGKLKMQIGVMEKYPEIEILFSEWWSINHINGSEVSGFAATQVGMQHLAVRHIVGNLWLVDGGVEIGILRSNFVQPATMVLKADVFKKVGGFNMSLNTPVDHEFCWRAAVFGARYAYLDLSLIERHKYHSSATARVIDASFQMIQALEIFCLTCETASRPDLLNHVRAAQHRTWRVLIRNYAKNGQTVEVCRVYWKSLRYGLSLRTFGFFIFGLAGPRAMSFATKFRARSLRPS